QQVADRQDRGARGREHVVDLKLRRIDVVSPRHTEVAQDVLREEGQIEAEEDRQGGQLGPAFGIEPSGDLRPPEVQSAHVGHHHPADHDVTEMRDHQLDKIHVDVERQPCQEQTIQSTKLQQYVET